MTDTEYHGFEQGPIRPPSEAYSLLIRITRNCPWNKCTFCPVYKGADFSIRPTEHVLKDIDAVYYYIENLKNIRSQNPEIPRTEIRKIYDNDEIEDNAAFFAAYHWFFSGGMKSVFLQDANSLIIKPADLLKILNRLMEHFPEIERITSYARSHTVDRISAENLKKMYTSGLNRIHIGLESGSDKILKKIKKGVTKARHISAGRKVKQSGMELSEYYMPGIGGKDLWKENAVETADAVNQIDPDFVRLRSVAVPDYTPLGEEYRNGIFKKCNDIELIREIKLFIEKLDFTGRIVSDHILNLLSEIDGKFPEDRKKILDIINRFLNLNETDNIIYRVGRRVGYFSGLEDLKNEYKYSKTMEVCRRLNIDKDNIDDRTDELMRSFI
ncbi:radical SAM protein [candidate division KSB1 bacterium]